MHVVDVLGLGPVPNLLLVMVSDLQGEREGGSGGRERGKARKKREIDQ